ATLRYADLSMMKMLKQLVRSNDRHKMKYRTMIEDFHDEDFVFQRKNGYPFLTKNLSNRMKRLLKFSEVKKKLTPHSFRHTHISMMTEARSEEQTSEL